MVKKIQNIAIAGHGTCGKTTLTEELLFRGKAIPRAGKVEDGTSILDHEAEERERRFSIDASLCHVERGEQFLQLIDTPGYPDFLGAVVDAFSVVETVLIAVDAVAGIRVNTRRVWHEAEDAGLGRMIVITRLDAENASFDERVSEIQEAFGTQCIPVFLPDQSGPGLSAVESTLDAGEGASDRAREISATLREAVIEADEEMMERYFAEEEISDAEINEAFSTAISAGTVVPIFCTSAYKGIGVGELLDTIFTVASPSTAPVERPLVDRKGEPVEGRAVGGENDPLLARVFKIVGDPFVGKLSYLRIFAGSVTPNMSFLNLTKDVKERSTTLLRMQGKDQKTLERAGPGEIIAIPKLESLTIGDCVGDPGRTGFLPSVPHPQSMVKLAVEPKSRNDETKIWEALVRLGETDSTFRAERVKQTRELVIAGRSTLHLEVMLHRLKQRYDLEVDTRVPKTSYLESITGKAEANHKHKKQTGGRGQYGEVYIRMEPAEAGTGLEFVNKIVGGAIPNQYIPAVEKGIRETMDSGILAGCPVVACKVTLYDGTFHTVDSSEAAFKTAGREAFKKAFHQARPCLLEPIANIEVHVPVQFMGDITGDLNSRRGRITGMDTHSDTQVVRAQVPEAEIKTYSTELRSQTGGEGSYSVEFSHYEVVPGNVQQQVIAQLAKEA
ncbi:MAG: elongation factor G, partial [Planctomycetota bacterium]